MSADVDETAAEDRYREGLVAFRRGDNAESRRLNGALLAAAVSSGNRRGQALGHLGLSRVCFRDGDLAAGADHAHQADGHADACGAQDLQVTALHMLAELTRAQGLYAGAVPLYRQLLAADEASGDKGALAMEHTNLGAVLVQTGEFTTARSHLGAALAQVAAKPDLLPYVLLGFGGLLARQGNTETAGVLLGAVQAHLKARGEVLDPSEALELEGHVAAGHSRDNAFSQALDRGAETTLEDARTLLEEHPS